MLLIKNLDPKIFEAIVVCPIGGPFVEELQKINACIIQLDIHYFNRQNGCFNYLKSLYKLLHVIRNLAPDIIHANSDRAAHWGIPIGGLLSVRNICHVRDRSYTRFTSFLLKHAPSKTRFITISFAVKEALNLLGVPDAKITTIHNGIDTILFNPCVSSDDFSHEFSMYNSCLKIGIVGRIEEWKRHMDVIEAVGLLAKQFDVHLFIVGELWRESDMDLWHALQARILELGLEKQVTFTGFREDIPSLMAGLDVIVIPSIGEPFGRTTIEAMAMGKPVIGTRSGGTPEIICDGVSGILVPIKSPESIASAISTIAHDKEYAKNLGCNARRRAVEAFSVVNHIRRVQEFYLQEASLNSRCL